MAADDAVEVGWHLVVDPACDGWRLDRFLALRLTRVSRARAARLAVLDEDDAPVPISARITPNKKNKGIVKKVRRGSRLITTYLRKTFPGTVVASASSDASLSDTVSYRVNTVP